MGDESDWATLLQELGQSLGSLPLALRPLLLQHITAGTMEDTQEEGMARAGGCHDGFAIFSFLAFALALFDFLIEAMIIMNPFENR